MVFYTVCFKKTALVFVISAFLPVMYLALVHYLDIFPPFPIYPPQYQILKMTLTFVFDTVVDDVYIVGVHVITAGFVDVPPAYP